jgi:hypothetical protein
MNELTGFSAMKKGGIWVGVSNVVGVKSSDKAYLYLVKMRPLCEVKNVFQRRKN